MSAFATPAYPKYTLAYPATMNPTSNLHIRQLETFIHVVRNGGINRSVGRMPYSIQQPAISEQMQLLEESLGCRLFERQPFRVTPEGDYLYQGCRGFFENLNDLFAQIRGGGLRTHVRIAAEEILVQHFLAGIARTLTNLDPALKFTFESASSSDMLRRLHDGQIDLAFTPHGREIPKGLASSRIVALPLVLLVDRASAILSSAELWNAQEITHPLVCPGGGDAVAQEFQRGLKRGGIKWNAAITVGSLGSVAPFVVGGKSIGVSLDAPCLTGNPEVRVLPLPGFEPVQITTFWRPPDTARLKTLVTYIKRSAHSLACTIGVMKASPLTVLKPARRAPKNDPL